MQEKEEEQFLNSEKFLELLNKQNDLLAKLHLTFGEDEEEARQKKLAKFFLRGLSLIAIGVSGLFGFWELGVYLKERWEINKLADRYAQVGVELYYTENNTDVAKQFLEKALELSPDNTEYLYLDAYIDGMASVRNLFNLDRPYNASELNEAYEALAKSVILENQKPDNAEPYILRGQIYAALNDNERAKNKLLEAIQLEPDNDFALMRLGVVEYNAGNLLEANEYLNQALSVNPESKWAYLWLGVISSDNSQVAEAMENFSRALEIDPRFDLAHYNIGWNYLSNEPKDYQKAESSFRTALSLNPDYKEAFYGLGMVFGYQRDYEVAKTYLTKSIELDPTFLTALKWRGIVNDELGLFDDALTDFSSAISIDPSQADLYVRRSRTLSKNASFSEALSDLQFARRLEPENHRIQLYLSRLYQKLGRRNSSMKSVNLALQYKPNYADAFAQRASLLVESGDFDLAVSEYFNAINATTYRLDRFHVPIGKIYLKQKQYEKALEHFRKARSINVTNSIAWKNEFYILLSLNRVDEAVLPLNKYIELLPNDPEIEKMKAELLGTNKKG